MMRSLAFSTSFSHDEDCVEFVRKFEAAGKESKYEDLVKAYQQGIVIEGLLGDITSNLNWLITDAERNSKGVMVLRCPTAALTQDLGQRA
jgi:hypothetical protein